VPQLVEQVHLAPDNLPDWGSRAYVVLVNRRVSPPGALRSEVKRVLARIPGAEIRRDEVLARILWFSWQQLATIFSAVAAGHPHMLLLRDELTFLARAGIRPATDFPVHQLAGLVDRADRLRGVLRTHELHAIHAAVRASRTLSGVIADVDIERVRQRSRSPRRP
jgi:hypothetical protein